jgi:hypothetical protein
MKYPLDEEIKIEWNKFHFLILFISSSITIGGLVYLNYNQLLSFAKFFSIIGLYIDIIGVLIASLKTPYLDAFLEAGELESKRANEEKKWFMKGMYLIAFGMILQVFGIIIQN